MLIHIFIYDYIHLNKLFYSVHEPLQTQYNIIKLPNEYIYLRFSFIHKNILGIILGIDVNAKQDVTFS